MLERVLQKAIEQQNKNDAASQGSSNNKTVMSDLNGEEPVSNDIDNKNSNKDDLAFLDKLVISRDSKWKGKFDLMMMMASIFNVFSNAYYSAFGEPEDTNSQLLDTIIEFQFLLDMIFCFCQEYLDEETYNVVNNLKQIAKHYSKGSFIFDFIAWFPFSIVA